MRGSGIVQGGVIELIQGTTVGSGCLPQFGRKAASTGVALTPCLELGLEESEIRVGEKRRCHGCPRVCPTPSTSVPHACRKDTVMRMRYSQRRLHVGMEVLILSSSGHDVAVTAAPSASSTTNPVVSRRPDVDDVSRHWRVCHHRVSRQGMPVAGCDDNYAQLLGIRRLLRHKQLPRMSAARAHHH